MKHIWAASRRKSDHRHFAEWNPSGLNLKKDALDHVRCFSGSCSGLNSEMRIARGMLHPVLLFVEALTSEVVLWTKILIRQIASKSYK
ncbi:hypothetical protein [Paenibacillus sp. GP183]|uniref:hypothetical protein n=1 Tax=Paenibacillus sp. GP183 TaxID=1882751 RepID=UPI001495EF4B|nr:hypothetical protein [Paenibacillus sp. GP183]